MDKFCDNYPTSCMGRGRRKARRSKRSGGNICRANPGCTDGAIMGGGRSKAHRSKRTCRKRSGGNICRANPGRCVDASGF